jgi:hypothetical protein
MKIVTYNVKLITHTPKPEEVIKYCGKIEHASMTLQLRCDLATARIFSTDSRVRLSGPDKSLSFIKPFDIDANSLAYVYWLDSCVITERNYLHLLGDPNTNKNANSVLNLSTAVEFPLTLNFSQAKYYLKKMLDGASNLEHVYMASLIKNIANKIAPTIFGGNDV